MNFFGPELQKNFFKAIEAKLNEVGKEKWSGMNHEEKNARFTSFVQVTNNANLHFNRLIKVTTDGFNGVKPLRNAQVILADMLQRDRVPEEYIEDIKKLLKDG